MKTRLRYLFILLVILLTGCASIPPEFQSAMDAEAKGIHMIDRRHKQAVSELVDNWYNERMERLAFLKQLKIQMISVSLPNPNGGNDIEVVQKDALLKLEEQYDLAVKEVNQIKTKLTNGYLDKDNWDKIKRLHAVNLDMTKSLLELNQAQRSFYQSIVGENTPYPSDFISEKTKDFLKSFPSINN